MSLTLWDSSADPPEHAGQVYRWNGYAEKDSTHSLLQYADTHGERLRRKYVAWVHDLGESRIHGKRLVDILAFEDGLSYWWMTLLAEQSPWKSPSIIDAIRLLALEEIVVQERPATLRLVSGNRKLHEALSGLCQGLGIAYEWQRPADQPRQRWNPRRIYQALPYPVQALIWLVRHIWGRWPLRQASKTSWFGGDRALFFCSYFDNVDPKAAEQGVFHSYYWADLFSLLHRTGWQSNWLQLFVPCATEPTPVTAVSWAKHFNQHQQEQSFHSFLDAYLSWPVVSRVLKRWLKLNLLSRRLGEVEPAFRPQGSKFSLWPLMRGDWYASLRGPVAISNLLWIELFEKALHELPHQKKGLYLCENQAWERALIHAWRKNGHGQLIAVQHSMIRFWDLRYFPDPRTVRSSDPYPMPQADLVALNGKAAVDAYVSLDYPKQAIAQCEALRYGHLNNIRAERSLRKAKGSPVKVLIVGDYTSSANIRILQLLEAAAPHMSDSLAYTMKPHPNLPVKATDYPSLHLKVVTAPLGEILHDFDIAYCSNLTSAAVDAYLAGLPVVVVLDETELNLSPLRGESGVSFVSTPEELAEALRISTCECAATNPNPSSFFFLDPELPRWSRLLDSE